MSNSCLLFKSWALSLANLWIAVFLLLGLHYSAADWDDYDNGDLDLVLVGEAGETPSFRLHENQQGGAPHMLSLFVLVSCHQKAVR